MDNFLPNKPPAIGLWVILDFQIYRTGKFAILFTFGIIHTRTVIMYLIILLVLSKSLLSVLLTFLFDSEQSWQLFFSYL